MATLGEDLLARAGAGDAPPFGQSHVVDPFDHDPPEPLPQPPPVDQRFRLFVDSVRDYAMFMLDPTGHVATWNAGAERIKGYRADQIIGQHISRFYTREDAEHDVPGRLLQAAEAQGRAQAEGWRVRRDGSRFWASVSITAVRDERGRLHGFGKVTRDLTERKNAEQALSKLSGRLVEAQERERKRIAVSLNDSTSPNFVALVSKLYQAKRHAQGATLELIEDGIALSEFLFREIRTVSYLLHPPSLDTEGLLVALRLYLESFAKQRGMPIEIDFPAHLERPSEAAEVALFRFVQECLPGVPYLSGDARAKVSLATADGQLQLQLCIEGQGLSSLAMADARGGLGELGVAIAGMRERLKLLGGGVEVEDAGMGTRITATLPVAGDGVRPA